MNLRVDRKQTLCIAFGTALILSSTGIIREESNAQPVGRKILQGLGTARQADPQPDGKQTSILPGASDQYTIGAEDTLQINVWHEPDISGAVSVRPDGNISVPLVGDLKVT